MAAIRLKSDHDIAEPELDELRTAAQDLAMADDWTGLLALRAELEQDADLWTDLWGPSCALAARRLGEPGAIELLAELVNGGFRQPELFDGQLESAFGDDPRWPDLAASMARGAPPPPILLTDWPTLTPAAPLGLMDLTGRAGELRALLPAPSASAWDTAVEMLAWVTRRWRHANAHMEIDDAVECLRRVDEGLRFACVEYSLVLSQALNAVGIPARRLSLRQGDYHVGLGRGHVVSEAWIDDLCRWVVLDGQNGMYWTDEEGSPLGAVHLQRAVRSSATRPDYATVGSDISPSGADFWFTYFGNVTTTGGTWSPGPVGVVFQRRMLATSRRLEHEPEALYPDLSEIGVETALDGDKPAVRLLAAHPYAAGFTVDGHELPSDIMPLDLETGDHELALAVRTSYGTMPARKLCVSVR